MEHTTAVAHHDHEVGGGRKEIYRVTIILSVLTLIELAFGYSMYYITNSLTIHFIKGVIHFGRHNLLALLEARCS